MGRYSLWSNKIVEKIFCSLNVKKSKWSILKCPNVWRPITVARDKLWKKKKKSWRLHFILFNDTLQPPTHGQETVQAHENLCIKHFFVLLTSRKHVRDTHKWNVQQFQFYEFDGWLISHSHTQRHLIHIAVEPSSVGSWNLKLHLIWKSNLCRCRPWTKTTRRHTKKWRVHIHFCRVLKGGWWKSTCYFSIYLMTTYYTVDTHMILVTFRYHQSDKLYVCLCFEKKEKETLWKILAKNNCATEDSFKFQDH